ncbi:MAG: flagellar motor protein MotB [Pseudomonadales bacterium]|nr:flagellar motor protein MotB [Pseudomonadales bacterium]
MEPSKPTTVIVKRVKKGDHGHHGGAWKIAYADFVTAMMAFFLMLWLLGSLSEAKKMGLSRFFSSPSAMVSSAGTNSSVLDFTGEPRPESEFDPDPNDPAEGQEELPLDELLLKLKEQIETSEAFKDYQDQLQLEITVEGLRIQMMDDEERPMFDVGSPKLRSYADEMLQTMGKTIATVPNRVSIAGHTDARTYRSGRTDYSNWELSADRANAARRAMAQSLPVDVKFGRIVGLADSVPYDREDPFNPANRRISIVVLNAATERAIGLREGLETKADRDTQAPDLEPQ